MIKPSFIYGLIDPRTLLIRYVGKTKKGMTRPKEHRLCRTATTGRYLINWIRSLQALGLDYEVVILEECANAQLDELERFWIAYGRASCWPLTNLTRGGDGFTGKHTEETRRKMSAARQGHPFSAESRAKLSNSLRIYYAKTPERVESLRNRVFTEEWRSKISSKLKGREITTEWRSKVSATKRATGGTKLTFEDACQIVAALRNGESPRRVAPRFKVSRSCIEDIRDGRTWKDAKAAVTS